MFKEKLLNKQMNRREFLGHIGALLLMVVGISGLMKFFINGGKDSQPQATTNGYGSQNYGGA